MIYAVIIAGGKGRRLWPKSTSENPKHLLPIISDKPMLEETIQRIESLIPRENIFIVTNQASKEKILKLIPDIKKENILGEPFGKNSAPAIAWASIVIQKLDPNAVTVVLPADHYIPDQEAYIKDLKKAIEFASNNPYLITFGIKPTRPDTGYGYVELNNELDQNIFAVKRFTEKPNGETAKQFLLAGNYRWNSGMFVWKTQTIIDAFMEYQPKMHTLMMKLSHQINTPQYNEAIINYFEHIQSISIDYAIMEKADRIATISASFTWDDVGSWQFLTRTSQPDSFGNIVQGNHFGLNTKNCIIFNDLDNIIGTVEVEDLIIVNTSKGVLICKYANAADVNELVKKIEKRDL